MEEPNLTNCRFILFGLKQRENKGMEQFYCALSHLSRGCDFGPKEESIVLEVFIFNMQNKKIHKQLSMETLLPSDSLQFAVVRER